MTVDRYKEIKRLIDAQVGFNKISQIMKCSKETIRSIRDGKIEMYDVSKRNQLRPLWVEQIRWEDVLHDLQNGHHLKFIWEEKAAGIITYSGFWKQFTKLYPDHQERFITLRMFSPGTHAEIDYAGDTIEYVLKDGSIRKANVFIGILCHSQLIFAEATANTQSKYFIQSHVNMYEFFQGVPEVTVSDCLKQGVKKCHLYDPDLNPAYSELARHYGTSIVPARVRHPKDKALTEGAVKIFIRYFKFINRKIIFRSLSEINHAIKICLEKINNRQHTRLKVSRSELWKNNELKTLKPLPVKSFEYYEWKESRVHPDSHIHISSNYYSVPYEFMGKLVKVKISKNTVEVFYESTRIAFHPRLTHVGEISTNSAHMPENERAYKEATPQNLLSQAKFINKDLHNFIEEKFQESALGNIRKVQGILSFARKEMSAIGHSQASLNISKTVDEMRLWNKFRVEDFKMRVLHHRKNKFQVSDENIKRNLDQSVLRHIDANVINLKGKL